MTLPAECLVTLTLLGPDGGPLTGSKVVLRPSTLATTNSPPEMFAPRPVEGRIGEDGVLHRLGADGTPGDVGVLLLPSDDPAVSPLGFTWTATVSHPSIASISTTFVAPSGGHVDLSTVVAVPPALGEQLIVWEQVQVEAGQARDAAVEAAEDAAASASSALASKTAAAGSATSAAGSASDADGSKTTAANSASAAGSSASAAQGSATAAAGSASDALASRNAAASSASSAATSAGTATMKAGEASTSATAASESASAAAQSAADALAARDEAELIAQGATVDGTVAALVGNAGSATGGALSSTYAAVRQVIADGTDQTAAINAAMKNRRADSRPLRVALVGDFEITAPIVIPSYTTADFRQASIKLKTGSLVNMVVNEAVILNKRTIYAAMGAGSATLTAATTNESTAAAPFDVTDVGKPVVVQGAGTGGAPLTATVSAYVSASQVTLSAPAATTVAGQYATVGARDTAISILGGVWDRNSVGPSGYYTSHVMRLRHVDDVMIDGPVLDSTGTSGKYAISVADAKRVQIRAVSGPRFGSDVVHISGPASAVVVSGVIVDSVHDDVVSLTAGDSIGGANFVRDTAGDITDVVVSDVIYHESTFTSSCLKIIPGSTMGGGSPYRITNVRARALTGPNTNGPCVFVGDATGGIVDRLRIDGVTNLGGAASGGIVLLHGGTLKRIWLSDLHGSATDAYLVTTDVDVDDLRVDGACLAPGTTGTPNIVRVATGTVKRLAVRGLRGDAADGSAAVRVDSAVTSLLMEDLHLSGGLRAISTGSGATALPNVQIVGLRSENTAYPVGRFYTDTNLLIDGLVATGSVTALVWQSGSGAVTIIGMNGVVSPTKAMLGVVRIVPPDADPDLLTTGEETINRKLIPAGSANNANTGQLLLTYITPRKTETINTIRTLTAGTAGTAATLCRVGVYSVAGNGDLTLIASSASDTAMWSGTFTGYSKALSAPWSKVAGQRYAIASLFVGGTAPKLVSVLPVDHQTAPRLCGNVASQSDLPASVTAATVANTQGTYVYASMTP